VPELPEVETIRAGLAGQIIGRRIESVQVLHPRAVRRHEGGAVDLAAQLTGQTIASARRRGKYLWLVLEPAHIALVIHLGMSGQLRMMRIGAPDEKHLRIRAVLSGVGAKGPAELRFVDQRTFGGWLTSPLIPDTAPNAPAGQDIPQVIAHIAPDPLEPAFDLDAVAKAMGRKHSEIKRVLLDQSTVSGVGNIYADEALWQAKIHGARPADGLSQAKRRALLTSARDVMAHAITQGGTSFDSLYVDAHGEPGYFERELKAYGRDGEPCPRCGSPIERTKFMNRSSFSCPRCQSA
jgi:formamidopyrimidine-DNA glycosylase